MLLSHIEPKKKLFHHLKNVGKSSKKIIKSKNLNLSLIKKKDLANIAYLIGVSHDFGKSTYFFQDMLKEKRKKDDYTKHSLISSIFAKIIIKKYISKKNTNGIFSHLAYLIIKRHHGNLEDIDKSYNAIEKKKNLLKKQLKNIENKKTVKKHYNELFKDFKIDTKTLFKDIEKYIENLNPMEEKSEIFNILKELKNKGYEKNIELFLINNLLFSCLVDADKRDAANILNYESKRLKNDSDFVDKYLEYKRKTDSDFNPKKSINKLRNQFYNEVVHNKKISKENKIYNLTAPTGIGKTFAIYSTSLKLKEEIKNIQTPKIIYSLPYTSIINQNFDELCKVLKYNIGEKKFRNNMSSYIINHHYLSKKTWKSEDYNSKSILNDLLLIEGWNSENIVTTFVQLFHSIIGYKNSFLRKFHNIVNSIIILDEIQILPIDYWHLVEKVFRTLSQRFNTYFILSTATQPYIFKEKKPNSLIEDEEKYFENELIDRVNLEIDIKKEKDLDNFFEYLKEDFDKRKNSYLIVLNTRKSATEIYNKINEDNYFKEYEKICLTNNLVPKHRKEKIEKIKEFEKSGKFIIISTQLIEAGVDISVEKIYRDLAPFDSIIQTAGRCNRSNEFKNKGNITVVKLIDSKNNDHPFSAYIYDPHLLGNSEDLMEDKIYNSGEFYPIISNFFKKSRVTSESKKLLKAIFFLNYDKSMEKETPIKDFRIIDDDLPKKDLFICFDEEGEKLLKKFKGIQKIEDPVKKLEMLNKIKPKLKDYIITITDKTFRNFGFPKDKKLNQNVFYLPKSFSDNYYDREIGIKDLENVF